MSSNADIDKILKNYTGDVEIPECQEHLARATAPYKSVLTADSPNTVEIQYDLTDAELRLIDTMAQRWNVSLAYAFERVMRDALALYLQNITIFDKLHTHNSKPL